MFFFLLHIFITILSNTIKMIVHSYMLKLSVPAVIYFSVEWALILKKIMIVEQWCTETVDCFKNVIDWMNVFHWWFLPDQEESGLLTKPHQPLTAMTKASSEAPAVPQPPASAPKATNETLVKSAESPAECGEWKSFRCVIQCISPFR